MYAAHQIAHPAFFFKLVGDLRVQAHRQRTVVEHFQIVFFDALDVHFRTVEVDALPFDFDRQFRTVEDRLNGFVVERSDLCGCLFHERTDFFSEYAEIRLRPVFDQFVFPFVKDDALDVEFFAYGIFHFGKHFFFFGIPRYESRAFKRLAVFYIELISERVSHRNGFLHRFHFKLERFVPQLFAVYGIVFEVYRFFIAFRAEILPNRFGDKGDKGTCGERKSFKHNVQRRVRFLFIAVVFAFPKTAAVSSDIPIVEFVDKVHDGIDRAGKVVGVERSAHAFDELLRDRKEPRIERILRKRFIEFMSVGRDAVDIRILHKKAVAVPQRYDDAF